MLFKRYRQLAHEAVGMTQDVVTLAQVEIKEEIAERLSVVPALAIAALIAPIALLFVCVAILVTAWDTQYRVLVAWLLPLVMALCSVGLVLWSRSRWQHWRPFMSATRFEIAETYQWLKQHL